MRATQISKNTGLGTVADVWHVWSTTLPIAWHPSHGVVIIITPADDADLVLVFVGPQRYRLIPLVELTLIERNVRVVLKDGRQGFIASFTPENHFFMFEGDDGERAMVPAADIIQAHPPNREADS